MLGASCLLSVAAMSYCLNPQCIVPENPDRDSVRFCLSCGTLLLLKDRYRALRKLGQGGFGRTFLACDEDIPSKPKCVIKQLSISAFNNESAQKAKQLFQQEAIRLDQLGQHPQIPALLAYFEYNGLLYVVQDWIEGQNLLEELRQKGAYTEAQIWQLLRELVPVLQFVHQRQVIHRDIKPANIMRRQSDRTPILIDFGIAKQIDRNTDQTGTIVGSAEYIAPEQMRGKALPASDIYSLGVMCIHLLTNLKSPLDLYNIVEDRWEWRDYLAPGNPVSDRLGRILDKMLQTSLIHRFQSTDDLLAMINPSPSAIAVASPRVLQPRETKPVTTPTLSLRHPVALAKSILGLQSQEVVEDWLVSENDLDCTQLRNHLAASRWKAADEETWAVFCQALGKRPRTYLWTRDIEKLSCGDLQIVDLLWQKYSEGHFGFNIQRRIFLEVGEDYGRFCDRVGWAVYNDHTSGKNINYSRKAPTGHLPSRIWAGGNQWWRHANAMLIKLESCEFTTWES